MLRDYCTWDREYNDLVTDIRRRLVRLATANDTRGPADETYTVVLMQGSGTFAVEAVIGSAIPPAGRLLVLNNGAYGQRMAQIAARLRIECVELQHSEVEPADPARVDAALRHDLRITHVALVHCETTTGMLNPAAEVGQLVRRYGKTFILDAMSSFAGIPFTIGDVGAHYLISSANKCIQGVPGFGVIIADRAELAKTKGWARSLSLDLYDQWHEMETKGGKWRYTSPTHAVRAFATALDELDEEGGIAARHRRYRENHRVLVEGMERQGFRPLLAAEHRSPIITSFLYPDDASFKFEAFYDALKQRGFVIYPGKISQAETFRVGTIGHVFPHDFERLIECVQDVRGAQAANRRR
jgi:2-aminoethylphosphonate-pyruvate transaminase